MYRRADATPLASLHDRQNRLSVIDVQSLAVREFKAA
jgi:hypothetical protein